MAIKDLLLVLQPECAAATRYAVSLAGALASHLTGATLVEDVRYPGYSAGELPAGLVDMLKARVRDSADAIGQTFIETARLGGIRAETVRLEADQSSLAAKLAGLARHFDLSIVQQPADGNGSATWLAEALLFSSGRPLVMAPYIHRDAAQLGRVLVAWDASLPSARAVAGAMPLLQAAKHVQVVTVNDKRGAADLPGFNIARHIARHGVEVELKRLTSSVDIGNTLLSHAADTGADLLVMGGYGHSRLREIIMGGTTRTVLESMTLPVLFAH